MRPLSPRPLLAAAFLALALGALTWWAARDARAADPAAGATPAAAASTLHIPAGTKVTVYFRGDAAGQAVQSYVGSVSNNASLTGALTSAGDRWLVLTKDKQEHHIPMTSVLMVVRTKD